MQKENMEMKEKAVNRKQASHGKIELKRKNDTQKAVSHHDLSF